MSTFYLGIDGGQSSTEALIADATGRVLGRGTAGPCNHVSGPEAVARFRNAITGAVKAAAAEAAVPTEGLSFEAACFGLSGGPDDKAVHIPEIVQSNRYRITHDAEIALMGALEGAPGIIVIAGTGSIAFGRDKRGNTARAGGWGYVFGDEGGAFDIARQALRAALRMEEGWGPPTVLRESLLQATGSSSAIELLHRCYTPEYPRHRVAAFAAMVDSAMRGGDAVAAAILDGAAKALAGYAKGVRAKLFADQQPLVSYTGGVFESELVRRSFTRALETDLLGTVLAPKRSAAEGALLEALRP